MEQTELLELIAKSQAGDRSAQELLVLAVQNRVYYHCLKTLRSEDDAMDAAQDILISMLSGLNTLRSPESFWAWLNQIICRTCCRRAARQRREVQLLAPEDILEDNLDDQISPEDALDNEENRRIIRELVDELPDMQRLCVLMYYYDEMSVKDIAAAMDTTEGTIKSRLHYARQRIKKGVERYTAQGFVLYGVSPLPFLQYFLQQEAAQHCLGAAAAKTLGEAVLAAGAAAGGAAAGGAAAVGGTAAIAGGTKAVAVALAGLLLAGGITGGVLLQRQKTPEPPPVQTVQQEIPVRVPDAPAVKPQPEAVTVEPDVQQVILPETPPDIPETPVAAPLATVVVPPAAIPEPEPAAPPPVTAPDPAPAVSAEMPDTSPPAWLFPAPKPDPEPEPVPVVRPSVPLPEPKPEVLLPYVPPVQWPTYEPPVIPVAPDPGVDPEPGPGEDPGTDPEPGPGVDPEPEVISKELVAFGRNSGYGYTSQFRGEWGSPLPEDMTYTSSDTDVAKIDGTGFFYTVGPGKAVLTAIDRKDDSRQYALTIIVQDQFDWKWTYTKDSVELAPGDARLWSMPQFNAGTAALMSVEWSASPEGVVDVINKIGPPDICRLEALAPGTAEVTGTVTFQIGLVDSEDCIMQDTFTFQVTVKEPEEVSISIGMNGWPYTVSQLFSGNVFPYMESSNPEVVSVKNGLLLRHTPGTADIFCYNNENAQEKGRPAAILHLTVESEPEPDPTHHRDISEFGFDFMGYGFTGGFSSIWTNLPKGMEYSSSDDAVVYIDSASGTFYTRTPGTVTLTAVDPEDPEHPYTLTLHVQDRFHWEAPVFSDTVSCSSTSGVTCMFSQLATASNVKSGKIQWTSSDPSIADINKDYPNRFWYDVQIIGHSPGTVTFTGVVTYQLFSPLGIQELTDTLTLEITVTE